MRQIVGDHVPAIAMFDGCNARLMAVCVQDGPDYSPSYAVYVALAPAAEIETERVKVAEWVAARGSKQRYDEAIKHFPSLKSESYRA